MSAMQRNDDGTLPIYAWPGAYPLFYLTRDCLTVCAGCANDDSYDDEPVSQGVHWEGEPMICECCNAEIESAYGGSDD